jgi:acyl dehydratase
VVGLVSPILPEHLPEYRVRARNLFRESANRIHDDEVARRHGFAGGLVAGTTVYAYLTRPLVAGWGIEWLRRGTMRVRFARPAYEGDELRIRATVVARSGSAVAGETVAEVAATTMREGAEVVLAEGVAGLAWGGAPVVPDVDGYPAAPLPAERVPASRGALAALGPLGAPELAPTPDDVARAADDFDEPLPVYRGPRSPVHPGTLLQQANRALAENVVLGPWVHVASDVAHADLAHAGERLTTRGRVVRLFERKGREHVELDLLVVAEHGRPIMHVRHTAIYRLDRA